MNLKAKERKAIYRNNIDYKSQRINEIGGIKMRYYNTQGYDAGTTFGIIFSFTILPLLIFVFYMCMKHDIDSLSVMFGIIAVIYYAIWKLLHAGKEE